MRSLRTRQTDPQPAPRSASTLGRGFWDGVEHEIEALDLCDFADFLAADHPCPEPPAARVDALRQGLGRKLRDRFAH